MSFQTRKTFFHLQNTNYIRNKNIYVNAYVRMYVDTLSSDKSVNNINSISTYGATNTEQHMSFTYVILQNGAIGWRRGDELLNKVIIFVFFAHKKYFHGFVKLRLDHWCHMDYFNNFLFMLMDLDRVRVLAVNGRLRELSEFIKKYLNLCSEDERRSYGFGTTWGRVITDRILIF